MPFTGHETASIPAYLLVYNEPGRPTYPGGSGWLLVTHHRSRPIATVRLTEHGAGLRVGPRDAKAVAGRVLREDGHDVVGWDDLDGAPATCRAVLAPVPDTVAPMTAVAPIDPAGPVDAAVDVDPVAPDVPPVPVMRVRRLGRLRRG